jgi:hypothetical protein
MHFAYYNLSPLRPYPFARWQTIITRKSVISEAHYAQEVKKGRSKLEVMSSGLLSSPEFTENPVKSGLPANAWNWLGAMVTANMSCFSL